MIVEFKTDLDTGELLDAIDEVRKSIKDAYPLIRYVIIQPDEREAGTALPLTSDLNKE